MRGYFLIIALAWYVCAGAQGLKPYSGPYKGGQATYSYVDTNEGRRYEGAFSFTLPYYYGRVSSKSPGSVTIKGNFKNDMRDGLWTYTKICNYKCKDNTIIHYKEVLKVEYKNGVRNGLYDYVFTRDGVTQSVLKTNTKNGFVDGKIEIFSKTAVDRVSWTKTIEGFAHEGIRCGRWKFREICRNKYAGREGDNYDKTQFVDYDADKAWYIDSETGEKADGLWNANSNDVYSDVIIHKKREASALETHFTDKGLAELSEPIGYKNTNSRWLRSFDFIFEIDLLAKPAESKENTNTQSVINNTNAVNTSSEAENDEIYDEYQASKDPKFPGGIKALYSWIRENINYTQNMIKSNIIGNVYAEFVVKKDGTVANVKILKSLSAECDKEAERVLLSMPKWTPGQKYGKNVSVKKTLIIKFNPKKNNKK